MIYVAQYAMSGPLEALVRSHEPDTEEGSSGDASSFMSSAPAEAVQDDCNQITAVASSPRDQALCCGRADGTLAIHDLLNGNFLRTLPGHATDTAITAVVWSSSGNWIASADDSSHVIIRKVQIPAPKNPKLLVWKGTDFRVEDDIVQLLISPDENYLLVATSSSEKLWDVSAKTMCRIRPLRRRECGKWIAHPTEASQLIMICPKSVHVYYWKGLEPLTPTHGLTFRSSAQDGNDFPTVDLIDAVQDAQSSFKEMDLNISNALEVSSAINSAFHIRNSQFIVYEISTNVHNASQTTNRKLSCFTLDALDEHTAEIQPRSLKDLSGLVSKLVGTFQNHLVFFDRQYWLCSWDMTTQVQSYKRHLFLPKDWLNTETLSLTNLTERGTLLCPRNGDVAVISGGLRI